MTELDTPWCPCQEERFEAYYPDLDKHDMPYVDGVDYLERVKTAWHWEQKRKDARGERSDFSFNPAPSAPRTRRGVKIIEENFPEADFVCPCCEAKYVEETTVTRLDKGSDDRSISENTMRMSNSPSLPIREILDKYW